MRPGYQVHVMSSGVEGKGNGGQSDRDEMGRHEFRTLTSQRATF